MYDYKRSVNIPPCWMHEVDASFESFNPNVLRCLGALLFLRAETFKIGHLADSLQLHPVTGPAGRAGRRRRLQQSQLHPVCGAVYQDPSGRGQEQEKKGDDKNVLLVLLRKMHYTFICGFFFLFQE